MEESERQNVASRSLPHKRWPFPFRSLCKVPVLHLLQRTTSGKFPKCKRIFFFLFFFNWFHVKQMLITMMNVLWIYFRC